MKSKWKLLYAAIATALLLSACGTDNGNENPDGKRNGSTNPVEETDKGTGEEQDAPDKQDDGMKEATLTASDAQDFSIAVLPQYTLTSEEPGKDSLFSNADGSHFMRIETRVKEEGTY